MTFSPQEAANYWKRISIFVHDCQPLFINLIGACYDEKRRPPPFHKRHVEAYLLHSSKGKVPTLDEMSAAVDTMSTMIKRETSDVPRTPLPGANEGADASEFQQWEEFFNGHDPAKAFSINESEIDYGACSHLRMSEYRTIIVTNNTDYKLTACWLLPDDPSKDDQGDTKRRRNPVFQVFPDSSDIKPRSSVKFKAQFRPTKENQYYCQTLECLAFVKSQRNFRLVSGEKLLPPWTASVQARGHTFYGNVEEFLPRANFLSRKLNFPPCPIGCSVYLTAVLQNNGDTPVKFEFQDSLHSLYLSEQKNILVRPRVGIVPSGGSQIIGLCFSAKEAKVYNESLLCILNDSPRNAIELHLTASGNVPNVIMDKSLYFKPICVGALSHRIMEMQNASRIPVRFAWSIPEKAQKIFSVRPQFGILRGNEKSHVTWTMIPNKLKKFETRVSCGISNAQETSAHSNSTESVNTVTLLGEGTEGEIVSDPSQLEFGTVCIGKTYTQTLTLLNQAAGVLAYDLDPVFASGESVEEIPTVEISESTGILPARAFKKIDVTVMATKQGSYEFDLKCYGTAGQKVEEIQSPHPLLSTRLKAHVAYPTMQITDLKGRMFEKRFLWDFCGIGHINKELSSDLLPSEIELDHLGAKEVVTTEQALSMLPPISLQLGAEEEGEEDTVVFIEFTNTGGLPTEFKFHFQNDAEVEVENWIDVGEPQTEEGKHHSKIIENKIFDIQPRLGVLNAGQTTVIKITYTHQEFGYHELPVLLHIKDGRRINLHLKGETILKEDMRIALPQRHIFNPVAIGDEAPPVQVFSVHNKGVCEVPFFFEMEPLAKLREENFGCDIFEFLDSDGIVPVSGLSNIRCIFRPLEHKDYSIDLPVTLGDGTRHVVTFCGSGFHKNEPEASGSGSALVVPSLIPATELPGFHIIPHLITYDHLGSVSIEHLDFSNVREGSVSTKILAIKSNSTEMLKYSWYIEEARDILGENLDIQPEDGVIEPGQIILCKVHFDANMSPILCSTRIKCLLELTESSDLGAQSESQENNGQVEEIIEEHPPKESIAAKKRGERMGVYEGITFSTRMKFERLDEVYTKKFTVDTTDEDESKSGSSQEPQLIYVGIDVSVLPREHISVADLSAELEKLTKSAPASSADIKESGGLWTGVEGILENLCLEIVNDDAVSDTLTKIQDHRDSLYKKLLADETSQAEPEEGPPLVGKLHDFVKFVLETAVY